MGAFRVELVVWQGRSAMTEPGIPSETTAPDLTVPDPDMIESRIAKDIVRHALWIAPAAIIALGLLLYIYFHPGVRSLRAAPADAAADDAADDQGADVVELAPRRESRGGG